MSTLNGDQFFGKNDVDAIFKGHPTAPAPFPRSGSRKDRKDYDQSRVVAALRRPNGPELTDIDPRTLHATQPGITRAGVQHYMGSSEVYKDAHQAGNANPVVYDREDGRRLLLSGHHRATAALLKGEQFKGVVVPGPHGPAR